VARRFEVSRRHDKLSFQHHYEVAGLSETEQDLWLAMAAGQKWSKSQLRAKLRETRNLGAQQETTPVIHLRVTATKNQQELWKRAADQTGNDLLEWITQKLDESAESDLRESEHVSKGRP
jgi:hypothetical protein